MASKKKKAGSAAPKSKADTSAPLRVSWSLDELPSSQHRTGLVGLAMLVRWLELKPTRARRGELRLVSMDANSATFELDVEGLSWLFDEAYAAANVEIERDKPLNGVEPLRVVEREEIDRKKVDKKTGKPLTKVVKKYVYPQVVPNGAFLLEHDPGGPGAWIKLWRDFVWSVLRAVPATRTPYEARADGEETADGPDAFEALSSGGERGVELPSTYFIGAQAATAENVAFRDRERFQFLLHFWPFAVGLSVPAVTNREGKSEFIGHTLSFPDVAVLDEFVREYERVIAHDRSAETAAYLPRQALIDLPGEAGLQFLIALRSRLKTSESKKATSDLVRGVDVFHVVREGNNVRVRSTSRIEPTPLLQDEYERIRSSFKDAVFRRQVLANLLAGKSWSAGFDRLFGTLPWTHFLRGRGSEHVTFFPQDVRTQFERFVEPGETA